MFYDMLFSGQPIGTAICINSKALALTDKKGVAQWLHGYREAISRLKPAQVIRIGKIVPGEEAVYANPTRYEVESEYIKAMRYGR